MPEALLSPRFLAAVVRLKKAVDAIKNPPPTPFVEAAANGTGAAMGKNTPSDGKAAANATNATAAAAAAANASESVPAKAAAMAALEAARQSSSSAQSVGAAAGGVNSMRGAESEAAANKQRAAAARQQHAAGRRLRERAADRLRARGETLDPDMVAEEMLCRSIRRSCPCWVVTRNSFRCWDATVVMFWSTSDVVNELFGHGGVIASRWAGGRTMLS